MTSVRDYAAEWRHRLDQIVVAIDHDVIGEQEGIDAMIDLVDEILARLTAMHEARP